MPAGLRSSSVTKIYIFLGQPTLIVFRHQSESVGIERGTNRVTMETQMATSRLPRNLCTFVFTFFLLQLLIVHESTAQNTDHADKHVARSPMRPTRSTVRAQHGMVASSQ